MTLSLNQVSLHRLGRYRARALTAQLKLQQLAQDVAPIDNRLLVTANAAVAATERLRAALDDLLDLARVAGTGR